MDDLAQKPTPTLADDVEEFEEKQADYQAAYNAGGHFKEQLEAIAKSFKGSEVQGYKEREIKEVTEIPVQPEVTPEVEGYVERVEKEHALPAGLADDYVKQVGMVATAPQQPRVKLPLTSTQIQQGLHHKVWEAITWLAQWCVRQMKMLSLRRA